MKRLAVIFALIITIFVMVSCNDYTDDVPPADDKNPSSNTGVENDGTNDTDPDKSEEKDETETPAEDINEELITVNNAEGLNEEILVSIKAESGFRYNVFYKNDEDSEYSTLDSELMIEKDGNIDCYILGIKSGKYSIKIEAESADKSATKLIEDINVVSQDRSGYAHFGYTDGIGAYNDDGTVKDGTNIIYVTNENKNTVKLTINGTEYVGLVRILQAQYKSSVPLLIRVIGSIKTNQWNEKNVPPRLADNSNISDDFFDNTFSTEYGENLANLIVKYTDQYGRTTYKYETTPEGLGTVRTSPRGSASTTTYKGSDFPTMVGKRVYDDDSYFNMLEVSAAKNITIEGVGTDAEFFQFGIGFEKCDSIEIKNITFTRYPEDALNFLSENDVTAHGNYWIHNNTFNAGYNAWDVSGERDKYSGDGSIDMAFIHGMTLSYNRFNQCKKTMLVGNSDSSRCMNITMHHNYFYKVGSRLPLCRNTNVHSYNNYFESCSSCASVRVNSYIFSEANYYKSSKNPFSVSGGAVKSYGDVGVSSASGVSRVTDRTKTVSNSCKPDAKTDYSKFDTNAELFYYDAEARKTDVSILLSANDVPDFVSKYAGAGKKVQLVYSN